MKASRNYIIGSPVPSDGLITIDLDYDTPQSAQAATFSFADMKYNKGFALNLQKDDGYNGDYFTVFNFLEKGLDASGNFVGVPTYTDGCGNPVKWKASFAVFSKGNSGDDLHDGSNPSYTSWQQYAEMAAAGYTLMNHAYGDVDIKYPDRGFQIKENEKYFYNRLKEYGVDYRTRMLVVPDSSEGFTVSARYLGYRVVCSTFGGASSDNQVVRWGSQNRVDTLDISDTIIQSRSHLGDDWNDSLLATANTEVDNLLHHTDGNEINQPGKIIRFLFSHGPGIGQDEYNHFISFVNDTKNNPSNNDNLWIPSMHEFWDYYSFKKDVLTTKTVSGSRVTITLDPSELPTDNQFLDASILVSQAGLNAVNVTGANSSSNTATGLINTFKRRTVFTDPAIDVVPPRIVSAVINTAARNKVVLNYDRPVTQSMVGAYEVNGTAVLSLTGSGTVWTLTLSDNMVQSGTQLRFFYRPQFGDAVDANNPSLKVCSYQGGYITFI